MGAYENAMVEEGNVEDFRREIKELVDQIDDKSVLRTCFLELNQERRRTASRKKTQEPPKHMLVTDGPVRKVPLLDSRSWSEKEIRALISDMINEIPKGVLVSNE